MEDFSHITNADNNTLEQWHANAYHTYCMCGGHTKSHMNKVAMKRYAEEMTRRGVSFNEEPEGGKFNGDGSI